MDVLICKKGNQEEAKEYDPNAASVYKQSPKQDELVLAGNIPIELSRPELNFHTVQVCRKQKCEVSFLDASKLKQAGKKC